MQIKTKGIIIKEQVISDNDKLVTILTGENGLIRAFAKGSKNIKSKNFAGVHLFCYSDFTIFKGRNKYIINEAELKESFFALRNRIESISLAQYFCEIISSLVEENMPSEDILKLMLNSLYFLGNEKKEDYVIKAVFEMRILSMSGYMPNLISCNRCKEYENNEIYFSKQDGVLLCEKCKRSTNRDLIRLTNGALAGLRHAVYAEWNKMFSFEVSSKSRAIFTYAAQSYLLSCIGKPLKTLEFYNQIKAELK